MLYSLSYTECEEVLRIPIFFVSTIDRVVVRWVLDEIFDDCGEAYDIGILHLHNYTRMENREILMTDCQTHFISFAFR